MAGNFETGHAIDSSALGEKVKEDIGERSKKGDTKSCGNMQRNLTVCN